MCLGMEPTNLSHVGSMDVLPNVFYCFKVVW